MGKESKQLSTDNLITTNTDRTQHLKEGHILQLLAHFQFLRLVHSLHLESDVVLNFTSNQQYRGFSWIYKQVEIGSITTGGLSSWCETASAERTGQINMKPSHGWNAGSMCKSSLYLFYGSFRTEFFGEGAPCAWRLSHRREQTGRTTSVIVQCGHQTQTSTRTHQITTFTFSHLADALIQTVG